MLRRTSVSEASLRCSFPDLLGSRGQSTISLPTPSRELPPLGRNCAARRASAPGLDVAAAVGDANLANLDRPDPPVPRRDGRAQQECLERAPDPGFCDSLLPAMVFETTGCQGWDEDSTSGPWQAGMQMQD